MLLGLFGLISSPSLTIAILAEMAFSQPVAEQPVFCARSELVLVPVAVTDRSGRPITGLTPEQFQVLDEHEPRPISSFWKEDRPVSLGLVLDLSGSMRDVLPRVIEALRTIAEGWRACQRRYTSRPRPRG